MKYSSFSSKCPKAAKERQSLCLLPLTIFTPPISSISLEDATHPRDTEYRSPFSKPLQCLHSSKISPADPAGQILPIIDGTDAQCMISPDEGMDAEEVNCFEAVAQS